LIVKIQTKFDLLEKIKSEALGSC